MCIRDSPWTDDEDPEPLLGEGTHLKWVDGENKFSVSFSDYRVVSFGSKRAFVVCEVHK